MSDNQKVVDTQRVGVWKGSEPEHAGNSPSQFLIDEEGLTHKK